MTKLATSWVPSLFSVLYLSAIGPLHAEDSGSRFQALTVHPFGVIGEFTAGEGTALALDLFPPAASSNIVLLCSTIRLIDETLSRRDAYQEKLCDFAERFIARLAEGQEVRVVCYAETTCVWSAHASLSKADSARQTRQFIRRRQIWDNAPAMTCQVSRLDVGFRQAIGLNPDVVILLTSGVEYGVSQQNSDTNIVHWTAADAAEFLSKTWRQIHQKDIPDAFRLTCIAFGPDAQRSLFCRDLATRFRSVYRRSAVYE